MRNKEKGITLIALIITIIVMLILVAVSISVALNTGLFKSAGDATKNWKSAQDAEANVGSAIKIGDKTYSSIEEYIEDTKPLPEGAGKRFSKTKEYTDGTKTAWIPAGFTVSEIRSETTIDGGLVIYDIPENELENVKWDGTEKTKYNQFVWIPVKVKSTDTENSIESFYRSKWADNAETGGERTTGLGNTYTEPNSTFDKTGKTGIAGQITELTKSIYRYGGFYIGRYEAGVKPAEDGTSTPRTSSSFQKEEFVVQQDKYPYNYVEWGTSMFDVSEGAVYLCNNLYSKTNANYGATSMLCSGASWDSILDFIKDSKHSVADNSTTALAWGNYEESEEYKINRGKYAVINTSDYTLGDFQDVVNEYSKEKGQLILLTTGATERNSSKNIYDIAGNLFEWTTESDAYNRVCRGRLYFCQ